MFSIRFDFETKYYELSDKNIIIYFTSCIQYGV